MFRDIQGEWTALLEESSPRSIFLTPQWQGLWWKWFGADHRLRVLVVRSGEGKLLGLCSLTERGGHSEFLGGRDLCDHLDIPSVPGHETAVVSGILADLTEEASPASRIDFHFIPQDSRILDPLGEAARLTEWEISTQEEETSPHIPLPKTWDEYLAGLRGKDRHELRRKIRRAESQGTLRLRTSTPADLEEDVETFLRLHAMSRPEKSDFMDTTMQDFFREAAQAMMAEGWLRLSVLELDGKPVAALFSFVYDNTLLVYNSGYDTDFSAANPGIALFGYTIREAIADGLRGYDFLRGNENYKYRLGGQDRPLFHVQLRPKA